MEKLLSHKILVEELELGMHVLELDRPWLETNFLIQGFIIQDANEIDELKRQCEYVFIQGKVEAKKPYIEKRKDSRGLFARLTDKINPESQNEAVSTKPGPPKNKIAYINKISFEKEVSAAHQSYDNAKTVAKSLMEGIRLGRVLDMNQSRAAVNDIVDSILRNNNALVWLTKLKDKDEYTAEHSLNVCILSVAFARHLGHDESEIRKIGLGGLLHDVGKSKIPIEVLDKPGRFTKEEFDIMKMHPIYGRDLLASLPQAEHSSVDIAYAHHERIDGKGYPRGLSPQQIPYYAKVVSLVDVYDAITSNRTYDKGRSSMSALDIIYQNKGTQFDEELALEFIKCIGIYPPGSIVELSNHHFGIVIAGNDESKLKPKIIGVMDDEKKWKKQVIIDLFKDPVDKNGQILTILQEIPDGTHGINIKEFIKNGLVIS